MTFFFLCLHSTISNAFDLIERGPSTTGAAKREQAAATRRQCHATRACSDQPCMQHRSESEPAGHTQFPIDACPMSSCAGCVMLVVTPVKEGKPSSTSLLRLAEHLEWLAFRSRPSTLSLCSWLCPFSESLLLLPALLGTPPMIPTTRLPLPPSFLSPIPRLS